MPAVLPCEKPLRMLLLHFPKQPLDGLTKGHTVVWTGKGCESDPEQLDQQVRKIIIHHHFLDLSSRRIGRRSS